MLSYEQIQQIDAWFEKNGLAFYDLRQEFVDHVAEGIQQKMTTSQIPFDVLFEEEVKKFDKRQLALQNFEAGLGYDPKAEWKYFTLKRIVQIVAIYGLLIIPAIWMNGSQLLFVELIYILIGVSILLNHIKHNNTRYKARVRKLSIFQFDNLWGWLFPILLITFGLLQSSIKLGNTVSEEKTLYAFLIIVFLLLFLFFAYFARMHYIKGIYIKTKKSYPEIFKKTKYAD